MNELERERRLHRTCHMVMWFMGIVMVILVIKLTLA